MGEPEVRYQCRQQYREDSTVGCPDRFSQDSHERMWWLDEAFKIVKAEYRSDVCEY